ncbi:MAG: SusC/RagA family TonB-linked outer membrane protein [Saprospiraceae bacterium]|nr:SusC/RagA family TonB-linked outer membrane protein [Saprospiraceae bacterium]
MKKKKLDKVLLLAGALMLWSSFAMAQFKVSGTVTDDTGDPLIGVTVLAKGTAVGTFTDFNGKYTINLPGESAELEYNYVGYATFTASVNRSTVSLDVVLENATTQLDEVVVTGLATSVKRTNLANSVASISSAELTGTVVPTTTDAALYGKATGTNISANSGAPGGGIRMNLRGITSINGSSQPLFIVDGVFIDNSSTAAGLNIVSQAAGGGSQSNQDNPSNRLADLDPNDIENIEILKGASAAAIYGSRASGGVVIITTKRGRAGKTKVDVSQSVGFTTILNPLGVRDWTEDRVANSSRYAGDVALYNAAVASGTLQNYEEELYGNTGLLLNTRLSITGGTDKTSFYLGASFKDEEGIVQNTGYNKVSVRLNLDHEIAKWLTVGASTNYIKSAADRGFFNNDNSGATMGVSFSATPAWAQLLPDADGNYPANPYAASNFLETAAKVTNREAVDRFLGGANATAALYTSDYTSVKLILRGGVDHYALNTQAIFPNSVQFQRDGNGLNGVSVQGNTLNTNTNLAAFLVWSQYLTSGISFRTQVGLTNETFDRDNILAESSDLIGSQTNVDQAGSRNVSQTRLIQRDKGFFAQEEVNINDQIILTAGIRGDKSSNNGDPNQLYYYPKGSVAINIHEFDILPEALSQLKLRAAYGESGNFATFGSKYTSFSPFIVGGSSALTIANVKGNENVGPERQSELEFGIDLGFSNNRFLIDATYYIKNVDDLLLNADVPSSSGFIREVTNAAALQNKGIEIGLNANIVQTATVNWFSRLSWWKNNALVTRLDVPSFTTGGFADFLGQYRVKEGHSPTEIIGVGADPDDDGLVVFGDAEPDFQMSWFNSIQVSDFTLTFLWHWKQGGENINLSTLLFDLNETTHDYDDTTLDPTGALGNGDYRLSQLGANTEPYIEDAGYIRLREVGLYYTIPRSTFGDVCSVTIGFSGTNLLNFFDYNSYDPEVSNFGSGGLSSGVEVLPFPSAKRYDFHLRASF